MLQQQKTLSSLTTVQRWRKSKKRRRVLKLEKLVSSDDIFNSLLKHGSRAECTILLVPVIPIGRGDVWRGGAKGEPGRQGSVSTGQTFPDFRSYVFTSTPSSTMLLFLSVWFYVECNDPVSSWHTLNVLFLDLFSLDQIKCRRNSKLSCGTESGVSVGQSRLWRLVSLTYQTWRCHCPSRRTALGQACP